jgi:acyl carrier protein
MDTTGLIAIIEQETGASGVSLSTRLDSLVEDSLEFLSLICAVESAFNFKVPDKKYAEVQTVGDLCGYIPDYVSN